MTETRTPRLNLPQWSSGSDAPSRSDFNGAFSDLEARAGFDAGDSAASLPVTNLVAGRSTQLTTASDGYTMYRYNGSAWQFTGGTLIPVAVKYRAQAQALTATAFTVEHPSRTTAGLTATYGGDLAAAGVLRSFDADDDTRGNVVVGWSGSPVLGTHGRLYVRTRRTGDLGAVFQSHASDAGNLLTVREPGGQDLFTVDAAGRLTQRTFSAFGGASLPTQSTMAVSPTSSDADAVTNGLLLYGQASATGKSILRVQPDNTADTTPIALIQRTGIGLGRLPWGTPGTSAGTMTLAANTLYVRTSGAAENTTGYLVVRKSDPTSPATEADPTKDVTLLTVGQSGISGGLPLFLSQRQKQNVTTMTLYRVGDFSASFLELARLVPAGGGGETAQLASSWLSDGRLSTGVWWKGTGTLREARQSIRHLCTKVWAAPGDSPTAGVYIAPNNSHTYTFPVMTVRSGTATDLNIGVLVELLMGLNGDGQVYSARTYVAVNGGAFNLLAIQENAQVAAAQRATGDVLTFTHRYANAPAGATFQIRIEINVGSATAPVYLRKIDLNIDESIFEIYVAS